jgi:hypothetical protein
MPDFNEGGFRDVSGEVVADSGDEDTVSEDEVLFEVCIECFVLPCVGLCFGLLLNHFIFYVGSK